jgi:hypothetical protein
MFLVVLGAASATALAATANCPRTIEADKFMARGGVFQRTRGIDFNSADAFTLFDCGRVSCRGEFEFHYVVDVHGTPINIRVVKDTYSRRPEHAKAAIQLFAATRYKPPRLAGKPVCVRARLALRPVLR